MGPAADASGQRHLQGSLCKQHSPLDRRHVGVRAAAATAAHHRQKRCSAVGPRV